MNLSLQKCPSPIFSLIHQEQERQEQELCLIASENYVSPDILEVTGSALTNKYAEGYPAKRYYAGCKVIDTIEQYAINQCKELFGVEHANVQPHAGSQANMAAYFAILKPGDTVLGMSLAEGGHLTHGHHVNFSGSFYNSISYGLDPVTQRLDYDMLERLALVYKPRLIIAGASAYSRIIDFERCAYIARKVEAVLMADIAHIAGLIAAGVHPTPVGHADIITSTTHKTLRGPRGGLIMCTKKYASAIDKGIMPGTQGGPLLHVIAAKALAFEKALQPEFAAYQKMVIKAAHVMAQTFVELGYHIVSGGTDNHLFVLDLRSQNITGLQAQQALEQAGIIVSRSCVPNDPQKPWVTSGIRIGTPAMITRGMDDTHALLIAQYIHQVLQNYTNEHMLSDIHTMVKTLCDQHPIYKPNNHAFSPPHNSLRQQVL